MTNTFPKPGDTIHALGAILLCEVALKRGDTLTLTADQIALTFDKNGKSFLSLVDDEDAQIDKWGEALIGPGTFPSHLKPYTVGGVDEQVEKERAILDAYLLKDPEAQQRALQHINRTFSAQKTSRTFRSSK